MNRRALLHAALAGALLAPARLRAESAPALLADDGSPIRNFPAPDPVRLAALPGLLARGPAGATATLVEYFDYNCGYCRQASPGLDRMLRDDGALRVVFVHNPVLGPGSVRAAQIVAAVQALHGVDAAYDLHRRLLETPGRATGESALALVRAKGLDAAPVESAAFGPAAESVRAQQGFAAANGLRFTPTFALAGRAFIGWPGVESMRRFVVAARRCGAIQCADASGTK